MMNLAERRKALARELTERFGDHGEPRFFRAPGRVDVMGSHTDYNQGWILSATIHRDLMAAARPRPGGALHLYSLNADHEVRVNLSKLRFDPEHGWANYPKGVLKELIEIKLPVSGMDFVVHGEVPLGGNLSSSAALEAVTCEAALGTHDADLPVWEKIHLTRRAENLFMNMPCGIMDQFTVFMGDKDKALLLDCQSLEFESIPFQLKDAVMLVINSGQGRELVGSKYPERVEECKQAVKILARKRPEIKSLRDAELSDLEAARQQMGETVFKRARHVLTENQRVHQAAKAMKDGDLVRLGQIMEDGYQSSSRDYENATPELEILHDLAAQIPGVLGVRICGAGWGGSLLALVKKSAAPELAKKLPPAYQQKTGLHAETWEIETSPGAGPL